MPACYRVGYLVTLFEALKVRGLTNVKQGMNGVAQKMMPQRHKESKKFKILPNFLLLRESHVPTGKILNEITPI